MARLFSSGFELNSTTVEFSFTGGSPTIVTTPVRSGTYAGRISSLVTGTAQYFQHQFAAADGDGPYYFRFYIRMAAFPSAANTIFVLFNTAFSAKCYIQMSATGTLSLYDDVGQIGSASAALSLNTWTCIEVKFDRAPAGGSEEVTGRINGVNFASATNRTIGTGVAYFELGMNAFSEAQTTGDMYIDDIAINDSTGSGQTSYAGEGKIVHLYPRVAGDGNTWLKSGGGAGDANNYQDVDEVTPDDVTTYLKRTTTGIKVDYYLTFAAETLGIDLRAVIKLVGIGVRGGATSATAATSRDILLGVKGIAGGTIVKSAISTNRMNTAGWTTHTTVTPRNYQLHAYVNPQDSLAWLTSTLNSMQIGMENQISSTVETRVSTIWALVEYQPGNLGKIVQTNQAVNRASTY